MRHYEEGWRLHQPANCGKVVSTKVGCGRFDGKYSRAAPGFLGEKESSMAAPIRKTDHNSLLTRRSIVIGAAASLICAPAIVRATNLMPVRRLPFPYGPQYAGFVDRLFLHSLETTLQAGLRAGRASIEVGGRTIPVDSARRHVAFAQAHGFLPPYICIFRED
jgi:hypothetical protein